MKRIAAALIVVTGLMVACHQDSACAEELAAPPRPTPRATSAPRPTAPRPTAPRQTAPKPTTRPTVKPTTPGSTPASTPGPTTRSTSPRVTAKPPKTVSLRPRGIDPRTPSAPTRRTRFGRSFRDPRTRVVFVFHNPGFYGTGAYWSLHQNDYLMDPYFRGGWWLGRYYPPNYLNPLSRWYHHPMYLAASCRSSGGNDFPANEQPDPTPMNVNVTNELSDQTPPTTVDTTVPPESTTTSTSTSTTLGSA